VNILINQIRLFGGIDLDRISTGLPMRREYDDSLRLDLGGYLAPNLTELAVSRVIDIIHDVWLVGIKSVSNQSDLVHGKNQDMDNSPRHG
jgi:hypothetical protein